MTPQQLVDWLIQQPRLMRYVRSSWSTIARHKRERRYDRLEAVRLLHGNVRDATRALRIDMSLTDRDRAAKLLLSLMPTE